MKKIVIFTALLQILLFQFNKANCQKIKGKICKTDTASLTIFCNQNKDSGFENFCYFIQDSCILNNKILFFSDTLFYYIQVKATKTGITKKYKSKIYKLNSYGINVQDIPKPIIKSKPIYVRRDKFVRMLYEYKLSKLEVKFYYSDCLSEINHPVCKLYSILKQKSKKLL